jgi:hypothetical protein
MTYFQKFLLGTFTTGRKNFQGHYFLKGYGGEKNFSMLVQDSLPIDKNIAKC